MFSEKRVPLLTLEYSQCSIPKISQLRLIATNSRTVANGITETWLDGSISENEINVENYTVYRKDRNCEGGGIYIFVRNSLVSNIHTDLTLEDMETL